MIASMFQLAGAILLAIMVAVRQDNEIYKYVSIIMPVKGKVHPRILEIYRETYLFRIGLIYVIVGYFLQIANLDIKAISNLDWPIRILITVFFVLAFCWFGKFISYRIANKKFQITKPFDPYDGNQEAGAIIIEE